MKLSYRWLDELVGLGGRSPADVAENLTFHTAAVEGVEEVGGGLDGIVTGHVVAVRQHPNADRLRLCTVDVGVGEPREVVCGAPNVAEGQKVCFAREGLTLPGGVKLKRAKIRGVESAGMICAMDELGLGEDHTGIIVLPEDTAVGVPVAEVLGVHDHVLEVDNPDLTHRPDLWGHVGFARELGAIFDLRFDAPQTPLADAALEAASQDPFRIEIEDTEGCRRYVGIVIENITNGPSPSWLRYRLEALGVRSISLLVDLTNLVMLEQGQPLHAFDLEFLQGDYIGVRRARAGERMSTLDDVERTLQMEDLLIVDGERPVAIAGVMGGQDSEVRDETKAILLEAANFDAVRIRRTASRLGLRTEASSRFEKSLDPESAEKAARRFTQLLLELVPEARVTRRIGDAYPRPYEKRRILLPYDLCTRRIGMKVSELVVRANLQALGFRVGEADDGLLVDVPTWRATKDVECAEDLVEEVGRILGYRNVPETPPVAALTPTRPSPLRRLERRVAATLSLDLGYAETKTYAFYGPRDVEALGLVSVPHLHVKSPISEDLDRMTQTSAAGLLKAVARNATRESAGRMWESTRLIVPREGGAGLPTEVRVISMVAWDRDAATDPEGELFRSLLQDVRAVLAAAPVVGMTVRDAGADVRIGTHLPETVWLHPGRRAAIAAGERVLAVVGEVAPAVARSYEVPGRAVLAEIDLEALLEAEGEAGQGYEPLHRYPVVPFDVAVVVPRATPAAEVESTIRGSNPKAVRHVRVFDVYEGEGIPEGHRSLAFRCELIDRKGTLTTSKADKLRQRVRKVLEAKGWSVRAGD